MGVEGSLYRASPHDVHALLYTAYPDEQIVMRIGDETLPSFIAPNDLLSSQGYAENDFYYNPVVDAELLVKPYLPGEEFLDFYLNEWLGLEGCDWESEELLDLEISIQSYLTEN